MGPCQANILTMFVQKCAPSGERRRARVGPRSMAWVRGGWIFGVARVTIVAPAVIANRRAGRPLAPLLHRRGTNGYRQSIQVRTDRARRRPFLHPRRATPRPTDGTHEISQSVFGQYSPLTAVDTPLIGADGTATTTPRVCSPCRRGASNSKPFGDGTHARIGFKG